MYKYIIATGTAFLSSYVTIAVSALGFQTNRVHVYLAQPSQPGQSRVHSRVATVHRDVRGVLGLPD